jgi:pyruvate dehydrogenase E2 component (dihydrolipoamide acetyltransferase)
MATEVKLPRLAQGMESGTIVRWLKAEGEQVAEGEPLYEVDTDKATQEVEAEASGVLLKIAVPEGEVEVGRTIALIGAEGESVADSGGDGAAPREAPSPERQAPESQPPEPINTVLQGRRTERVKASPLARRVARERGVDLSALRGSGPDGRIVAEDVERAAAAPEPAPARPAAPAQAQAVAAGEVERRPLTNVRRTIARRLTDAWAVPVFQLTVSAEMTRANGLVAKLREAHPDVHVTVGDLLTKLAAAALMRHREVNARFTEDAIELFPTADVGIAVAAPQGLVVPVIRGAERLTIAQIAAARTDLVERARTAKLRLPELEGGTFTISNLGPFGIEQFVAVLNPPQAAILAVGSTQDRVVAVDGRPAVRPMVTLTLTCDHRAIDGADGAAFLQTLVGLLEEPGLAL